MTPKFARVLSGLLLGFCARGASPGIEVLPFQVASALPPGLLREITVLDVNFERGVLAYRAIPEPSAPFGDADPPVIDCRYPGLKAHPKSAVIVGVYDLKKSEFAQAFVVYREATRRKECSSPAEAARELAAAKAYLREQGLDPQALPAPLRPRIRGDTAEFTVTLAKTQLTLIADSTRYDSQTGKLPPEIRKACGKDESCGITRARIRLKGRQAALHLRYKRDNSSMGGGGTWRFPQLVVKDGQAVFMEVFEWRSWGIGGVDDMLSFSPVLNLEAK